MVRTFMMDLPPPFEFEGRRVDPSRNALISAAGETRLGSRAMSVLVLLAGSSGRVVPREELLETVWNGRAVTDDALTVAIHDLRKALGDRPNRPRFVETIPGRGYRWLVPVREAPPGEGNEIEEGKERQEQTSRVPIRPLRPHRPFYLTVGLTLGVAGVLAFGWWGDGGIPAELATVRAKKNDPTKELSQAALAACNEGVEASRRLTPEGLTRAVQLFEQAAELAPHSYLPHALLADSLLSLSYFPGSDRADLSMRAMAEAREALTINPNRAGAYLLQGIVSLFVHWDLEAAEQAYWQAIQLDDELPQAYERYAWVLIAQGRFGPAEIHLRKAIKLAPNVDAFALALAQLLTTVGKPAEALEILQPKPSWEAPFLRIGWFYRARVLEHLGRNDEACSADLEFLKRSLPQLRLQPYRQACDTGGLPALHELWLETLEGSTNLHLRALLSLRLGRADAALSWLRQMHRERDPLLLHVVHDPSFSALRDNPEFRELVDAVRPFDVSEPPSIPASSHPSWAVKAP